MDILFEPHPILVHFPIALISISVLAAWAYRFNPSWAFLKETTWFMFWVGTVFTIPSVISGLIAHTPYEETAIYPTIETHQFLALITTILAIGITLWRFFARRRGNDVGDGWIYLGLVSVVFVMLIMVGNTGGTLVYELGVNVQGINPLLGE